MFVIYSYFPNFSLRTRALFGKTLSTPDTRSPAGDIGRGLGAIHALWSAWRALKVFFSRREWVRHFPWFQYEMPYFVPGTHVPVKFRQVLVLPRADSPGVYLR